ncbi:MAG: HAMP domain-containing protein [Anaerolineales bacterium]|nr:HAMP domain-containing protein [Anaerolineales bacterium]
MNRLWVRSALIIAIVIFMTSLLPILYGLLVQLGVMPEPLFFQQVGDLAAYLPPDVQAEFVTRIEMFMREYFLRSFLSAAGVGILAGIWLSRIQAAPLQDLEKGANAIAAQSLSHRITPRGSQEIQAVAHSFNQMATQLEQAEALRRNLLADVAHELRHPLHILHGNLQAILDDVYPLEKEEIARLLDQTRHLTRLVADLHELALAEAHKLPLHKQVTDIATLVKETAVPYTPLARSKQIDLHVELLGTIPTLNIDADRIRQVIHNLLDNALYHTPDQGKVVLLVEQQKNTLRITVQDSGPGIPPAQLPHVFDRFYRTDSARSRDKGGAGLGLAIVKAIVEAHEGTVTAVSDGKHGSQFNILLPL